MAAGDIIQNLGKAQLNLTTGNSASFSTLPLVGNFIVVVSSSYSTGSQVLTPTDNQSNSYTVYTAVQGNVRVSIAIAEVSTSSGTFTVTTSFPTAVSGVWVAFEVEGIQTSGALDAQQSNGSSGTSISSLSTGSTGTLAQASEIAIAVVGADGWPDTDTNTSGPAGWANQLTEDDSNLYIAGSVDTLVTTATTALNPSFSFDAMSSDAIAFIVTFRLVAAASRSRGRKRNINFLLVR
jgi:hypothetical protein